MADPALSAPATALRTFAMCLMQEIGRAKVVSEPQPAPGVAIPKPREPAEVSGGGRRGRGAATGAAVPRAQQKDHGQPFTPCVVVSGVALSSRPPAIEHWSVTRDLQAELAQLSDFSSAAAEVIKGAYIKVGAGAQPGAALVLDVGSWADTRRALELLGQAGHKLHLVRLLRRWVRARCGPQRPHNTEEAIALPFAKLSGFGKRHTESSSGSSATFLAQVRQVVEAIMDEAGHDEAGCLLAVVNAVTGMTLATASEKPVPLAAVPDPVRDLAEGIFLPPAGALAPSSATVPAAEMGTPEDSGAQTCPGTPPGSPPRTATEGQWQQTMGPDSQPQPQRPVSPQAALGAGPASVWSPGTPPGSPPPPATPPQGQRALPHPAMLHPAMLQKAQGPVIIPTIWTPSSRPLGHSPSVRRTRPAPPGPIRQLHPMASPPPAAPQGSIMATDCSSNQASAALPPPSPRPQPAATPPPDPASAGRQVLAQPSRAVSAPGSHQWPHGPPPSVPVPPRRSTSTSKGGRVWGVAPSNRERGPGAIARDVIVAGEAVRRSADVASYDSWLKSIPLQVAAMLAYPNQNGRAVNYRSMEPTQQGLAGAWRGWATRCIPGCKDTESPARAWYEAMPSWSGEDAVPYPAESTVLDFALRVETNSGPYYAMTNTCLPCAVFDHDDWRRKLVPLAHGPMTLGRPRSRSNSRVAVCWRYGKLTGLHALSSVLGTHLNTPPMAMLLTEAAVGLAKLLEEMPEEEMDTCLRELLPGSSKADRELLCAMTFRGDFTGHLPRTALPDFGILEVMLAVITHGLSVGVSSPIHPDASDQHIANEKAYRADLAKDSFALLSWDEEARRWTGFIKGVTTAGESSWKGACCSRGLIPDFEPEHMPTHCGVVAVLPPDRETSMQLKKPKIVKAVEMLLRLAKLDWVGYSPGEQLGMPSWCREPVSRQGQAGKAASSPGRIWTMPSCRLATTLPLFVVIDWAMYQELYLKQLPNGVGFLKSDSLGALADQFMAERAAATAQHQATPQPSRQDATQLTSPGADRAQAIESEESTAHADAMPRDGSPQPPRSRRSSASISPSATKSAGTSSPASSSASSRSRCPPRQRGQAAAVSRGPPARALSRLDSSLKDADAVPLGRLEATDSTQRMTRARRRQLEEQPADRRPSPPPSLLPLRIGGEACTRRGPPLKNPTDSSGACESESH